MLPLWARVDLGAMAMEQCSSITGISQSDSLVLNQGHSLGGSYLSTEMQSVYSTASNDWAAKKTKITYWFDSESVRIHLLESTSAMLQIFTGTVIW